ncbi:MAG: threonine synthase [Chloroflexota bacterium]
MNQLYCKTCGATYSLDEPGWKCRCGAVLDIAFEAVFDREKIRSRKPSLWRYREAIPIPEDADIVSFDEGFTPLLEMAFGGRKVYIKQDYLFPTGSYKDRGATVMISKLKELGVKSIVEDSSGNAGAAIAAYAAKAGIACRIFVPENAPPGKTAQIQMYGARLVKTPGSREDTVRAVQSAAATTCYASHSWNPFFFQGTKTFAYEICEQLQWLAPDVVVLPVGNGTLLLGAYIGFVDLFRAGVTGKLPKIVAVQAANCAPLSAAFAANRGEIPKLITHETIADGIAIVAPVRGGQIVAAVRHCGGGFVTVTEDEIVSALLEMGQQGYYIEPTSAATIAGLEKYLKIAPTGGIIVSTLTGSGLKETEKISRILAGTPDDF